MNLRTLLWAISLLISWSASAAFRSEKVIETAEAIFLTSPDQPRLVFYFPKTEALLTRAASGPTRDTWYYRVSLKRPTIRLPSDLTPEWAQRTFRSITLRNSNLCEFPAHTGVTLISPLVQTAGAEIASNFTGAVCQFSFSVETGDEQTIENLRSEIYSGAFNQKTLRLELQSIETIPLFLWSDIQATLNALRPDVNGSLTFEKDEALFWLGIAVGLQPNSSEKLQPLGSAVLKTLVFNAQNALFTSEPLNRRKIRTGSIAGSFELKEEKSITYDL